MYFPRRFIVAVLLYFGLIVSYTIRMSLNVAIIPVAAEQKWSEQTKGIVLSAFYWGYITTQLPGGLLAKKYGAKVVFGWGLAWASVWTIIWPFSIINVERAIRSRSWT